MTILADSGAIYALMDRDDSWHERVRSWWTMNRTPILLPITTLPEITWLLQTRIGPPAEQAFAQALADGEFMIEPLHEAGDLQRIAELLLTYRDTPIGFVDASLIAIAERVGAATLLTTDRRHFSVARPRHVASFELVP